MQQMYAECFVKGTRKTWISIVIPILTVISVYVFLIANSNIPYVGWLIGILPFVGIYYMNYVNKVDYEYVFVTDEVSIDKIISGNKRVRICTILMEHVEQVAPMNSHAFDGQMGNKNFKKYNYTSGAKNAIAYGVLGKDKDNNTALFILELNHDILNMMRRVAPRKVTI